MFIERIRNEGNTILIIVSNATSKFECLHIQTGNKRHYAEWKPLVYCMGNPLMYLDSNGNMAELALAGAGALGGNLGAGAAFGAANFWNPVGWVVLGVVGVAAIAGIYYGVQSSNDKATQKAV